MRITLFNQPDGTLTSSMYAMCMRVAFLLGDHLLYAGWPHHAWALLQYGKEMPALQRLNILRENHRAPGKDLEQLEAALYQPEDTHAYRKAERKTNYLFDLLIEETRISIKHEGYFSVDEVWAGSDVIQVLPLADDVETDDDEFMPYSQWLTLQTDYENADINLLTGDFFSHPLINNTYLDFNNPDAKDLTTTYMHRCFMLPNLATLSMEEMIEIREALKDTLTVFRQQLDNWCTEFWNEGLADENIDHFKEKMLPVIKDLQLQLANNAILKKHSRATLPENQQEVFMGEVPIQTLWQFYKDHNIIPPNTWANLQEAIKKDDRLELRWPVMVVRSTGTMIRSINEKAERISSRTWSKEGKRD